MLPQPQISLNPDSNLNVDSNLQRKMMLQNIFRNRIGG
jgi:hypothetical protein